MQIRLIAVALLTSFFGLNSQLSTARAQAPFGNALMLDGVNQHVTVPTAAGSALNSPLTVEAWVYVRDNADWSRLMDFGNGPGFDNIVCVLSSGPSGQPALYFFDGSATIIGSVTSPTALPLNTWTHLAFSYDGTNGSIFINGNSVAGGPMPMPPSATRTNNFIGRSNFSIDAYAHAMIDEFRIWSVARSPAQIQASRGAPLVGNEPGLLLYYRFDGIGSTVATNSATATGAAYDGNILANTAFSPGARTVGDPYWPEIGNGGYDVQHYDLTINYNPVANAMVSRAAIAIRATQALSEFSLDLHGFPDATVTIDGVAAGVARQDDKLILTPASGIVSNRVFETVVHYSGTPTMFQDPDGGFSGWVPITNGGGGWVVCEPRGSMGWFPNNNHPSDKATYDIHIKAPTTHTALGNGELTSKVNNGDGTSTWNWHMGFPMASYLATATVALFDYTNTVSATTVGASGNLLEIYNAIESALSPAEKAGVVADAALQDGIIKFIADDIGTYPFDSTGVVLFRIPELNYALEVQTKSHFTWVPMYRDVLAHEIAHQWFGDYVSPATWREVWFNEGFATWWQWYWDNQQGGAPRTVEQWFTLLYSHPSQTWNTPPANLPDASWMFEYSTIYRRPAMMHEAYRQIAGASTFFALQRAILSEHAYGNITTGQFIALAKRLAQERSGFDAAYLAKLDEFFQQWLYGVGKPTLTPSTFFLDLQPRLTIRFVSASQLEITWRSTSATYSLEETDELSGTSWSQVLSPPVVNNGVTKVTLVPPSGNHFYRLRKN